LAGATGGFFGSISGLNNVTLLAGSNAGEELGTVAFGLNSALENIQLQADESFTAWFTNAALAGTHTVNIDLNLAAALGGFDSEVRINTGANQYSTIHVITEGGHSNDLTLNAQAPTITVSGGQHLDIGGSAVDLSGPIVTFDASATTGGVHADFLNNGSATVIGGSGSDHFEFAGLAHNITVSGGAGDDTFTFDPTPVGAANFKPGDSADGGPGNDTLEIGARHGEILLGGSIVNIETVRNVTGGTQSGDLTADMSKMGSATTFQLDGTYNDNFSVTVNNLTDAQTVLFTGDDGNLFLHHAGLFGTDHLTMAGGFIGKTPLNSLHTDMGFGLVVQSSTGSNVIASVSDVNTDVTITGGGGLQFGNNTSFPYSFANGTIDASTDTGGVSTFLADDGLTQIFKGGTGNDTVNFLGNAFDKADFSTGGTDTAVFYQATNNSSFLITNPNYLQVTGFTANDGVSIHIPFAGLSGVGVLETTQDGTVNSGDAVNPFSYKSGFSVDATGAAFNFIDITTSVNTGGATTVQQAWANAIGGGSITVITGTDNVLAAFYDVTNSQAVFVAVNAADNVATTITGNDHVDVVGMIHESQADFLATAGNVHFV
jgi:hypothetical protein